MRILVAGVGNIFFGDDGFGPQVARALASDAGAEITVADYGIRGLHLAYEITSGYDHAILIDAVPRGEGPGTLYVIEPQGQTAASTPDAHKMDLEGVFALIRTVGGDVPPITIVGCEPANLEDGIGLSVPVNRAVPQAVKLVRKLLYEAKGRLSA